MVPWLDLNPLDDLAGFTPLAEFCRYVVNRRPSPDGRYLVCGERQLDGIAATEDRPDTAPLPVEDRFDLGEGVLLSLPLAFLDRGPRLSVHLLGQLGGAADAEPARQSARLDEFAETPPVGRIDAGHKADDASRHLRNPVYGG